MNRQLICIISGNKYLFAQEYYNKKVEEYGSVDDLKRYYVSKKVKSLLSRSYSVQEIRNILSIDASTLLPVDDQRILDIVAYYKLKGNNVSPSRKPNAALFNNKTDPEVTVFINNIRHNGH